MATLYGGLDAPGPYLALINGYPSYVSGPHLYAIDRLSLVLSGMWWVNSGTDSDPAACRLRAERSYPNISAIGASPCQWQQ
jgi:hypothetical protein